MGVLESGGGAVEKPVGADEAWAGWAIWLKPGKMPAHQSCVCWQPSTSNVLSVRCHHASTAPHAPAPAASGLQQSGLHLSPAPSHRIRPIMYNSQHGAY